MELLKDRTMCCGCKACLNVCPRSAIHFVPDRCGFEYPEIDSAKCVDCGVCKAVCPIEKNVDTDGFAQRTYICVNRDREQLNKSASGGLFAAAAKYILDSGGVVVGCAYNTKLQAEHIIVTEIKDLYRLQNSKYVQSNMGDCCKRIKAYLNNGVTVLFSGMPCQCHAVKAFLGRNYPNLICMDSVCHGVPSQKMLGDYIRILEKRLGGKLVGINFRDKTLGWGSLLSINYIDKNEKERTDYLTPAESSYYFFFKNALILRDSCYSCKYAAPTRVGDITMGDFWGVQGCGEDIDPRGGASMALINSAKGAELFARLKERIEYRETKFEYAAKQNSQLVCHSEKCPTVDKIREIYSDEGYAAVDRYFIKNNRRSITIGKLKKQIKFILRRVRDLNEK